MLFETETFKQEFEMLRLSVTEKFDENGLYFHYEHGINPKLDTPLLNRLQNAYFNYLDAHFEQRNEQHYRDQYKQDNLSAEQIDELFQRYKYKQKVLRKSEYSRMENVEDNSSLSKKQTAKVILVSYSWELHDENIARLMVSQGKQSGNQ